MKDREVIGGFVIIFCLTYLLFRGIQILAVSGWLALLSAFLDLLYIGIIDLLYIGIIGLILLWLFRLILDSAKRGKGKDND